MSPVGVLTRPRATLREAARCPQLGGAVVVVVLSGIGCLVTDLLAAMISRAGAGSTIVSLSTPPLLVLFWLVSGLLVGAGARLLGLAPRRRRLLSVTALTFPILVAYTAIGLLQAMTPHLGGGTVSTALGLLALPVIAWFVVLNVIAVAEVYDTGLLAATAIALIPYAALSGGILLLIVGLSILHSLGSI